MFNLFNKIRRSTWFVTPPIERKLERYGRLNAVLRAQKTSVFEYDIIKDETYLPENFYSTLDIEAISDSLLKFSDFENFIIPEDVFHYIELQQFMYKGEMEHFIFPFRIYLPGQRTVWLSSTYLVYERTPEGNPAKLIISITNVTEEKERQQKLEIAERRNLKIIEVLPDTVYVIDNKMKYIEVLTSKHEDNATDADSMRGKYVYNFCSEKVTELFSTYISRTLSVKKLSLFQYEMKVNGKSHFFEARMVPFQENNVLCFVHNITDVHLAQMDLLEAKERAEESDRLKSAFLANMSHEIRTPLNAIVGFSEIITQTDDEEDKKLYCDIIKTNNELLLKLINDVLDLSRLEAGKMEIQKNNFSVWDLLEEVRRVYLPRIDNPVNIVLENIPADHVFCGDKNKITQVVSNFIANAIKHTAEGCIRISYQMDNAGLTISVSDTGRGIPEDKLDVIFQRFVKVDDFAQGAGLGLSICKSLVDAMSGTIAVESVLHKGSKFTIKIPHVIDN